MPLSDLANFFEVEDTRYIELGIKPKSCGGGEEFKYFALIGDKFLDLVLIEKLGEREILNTGRITKKIASMVNANTLGKVAKDLGIPMLMKPLSPTHKIHNNELKESVEALLGICYLINGYSKGYSVAQKLIDLLEKNAVESNYKGKANELLQKRGFSPAKYETDRIGGSDHEPIFQSTAIALLKKEEIRVKGNPKNSKKEAEREAAKELFHSLIELFKGNA